MPDEAPAAAAAAVTTPAVTEATPAPVSTADLTPESQPADTTPTDKTTDTPVEQEAAEADPLAEILGKATWAERLDIEKERQKIEGSFKVANPNDVISTLSEPAQQLFHNLRARMLQAAQAESKRDREHAARLAEYAKATEKVGSEKQKMLDLLGGKGSIFDQFREQLKAGSDKELDPYSPEGRQQQIDAGVAAAFDKFFSSINEQAAATLKTEQETVEKAAHAQRTADLELFVSEHPDFMEHIDAIETLKAKHPTMSPVEAYNLVLYREGKHASQATPTEEERLQDEAFRASPRSGSLAGATGGGIPDAIMNADTATRAKWLINNPEAAKTFVRRLPRR